MFKGFKEFTYKMVAGANVATIIIMLLVGFSDFFQPEKFAALANLGLLFPVFLIVNLGFLLFWLLFRSKYAIIPFLGFLICFVPVRKYMPINFSGETPKVVSKFYHIIPGILVHRQRMPKELISVLLICRSRMLILFVCRKHVLQPGILSR